VCAAQGRVCGVARSVPWQRGVDLACAGSALVGPGSSGHGAGSWRAGALGVAAGDLAVGHGPRARWPGLCRRGHSGSEGRSVQCGLLGAAASRLWLGRPELDAGARQASWRQGRRTAATAPGGSSNGRSCNGKGDEQF
jgi:hypothetical protein